MKVLPKNKGNLSTKILLLVLIFWIAISLVRTFYNLSKFVTEDIKVYVLSDEQKRALEFGDSHYFLRFVQAHTTTGSNILFFTDNTESYFLSRYYLYPTRRYGRYEDFLWNAKNISYDYYMIYPANHKQLLKQVTLKLQLKSFKKIATYHGTDGEIGILYKK